MIKKAPLKRMLVGLLCFVSFYGNCQGTRTIYENYKRDVEGRSGVDSVEVDNGFGDLIDKNSGEAGFYFDLINIPGNNSLDVAARFKYTPKTVNHIYSWVFEADVPYIYGIFSSKYGWVVGQANAPSKLRCSHPGVAATPPEVPNSSGKAGTFFPEEYWDGYHLVLPHGRGASLNQIIPSASNNPSAGGDYYWATNDGWYFSCLPISESGGEGFLGISPNGDKYYFNRVSSSNSLVDNLKKRNYLGETVLARSMFKLSVSRIEDRFGNSVEYFPEDNPNSIISSDGRHLDFSSSGSVEFISDGTRQWSIQSNGVISLNQPDGSSTKIERSGDIFSLSPVVSGSACSANQYMRYDSSAKSRISVTMPSGGKADFDFEPRQMGYSYMPYQCYTDEGNSGNYFVTSPDVVSVISVVKKTITGPGLSDYWIEYRYDNLNNCYSGTGVPGACNASSATTRTTTLVDSDGKYIKYHYGNKVGENQGKLMSIEEGMGSSLPVKITVQEWEKFNGLGLYLSGSSDAAYSLDSLYRVTMKRSRIYADGMYFEWAVDSSCGDGGVSLCFDSMLRPTRIFKSSVINP